MHKPSYRLKLGSTTVDSTTDKAPVAVDISVVKDMDVPIDILNVCLVGTNQLKIQRGDTASLELGSNGTLVRVMEGKVDNTSLTFTTAVISVFSAFSKLARLRANEVYLDRQAGDIVKDLAQKAGVDVAENQAGINLPAYVVNQEKNAYEHCRELAEKCGFDLYCDTEGKLVFKKFNKKKGDYTLRFAIDILSVDAFFTEPPYDKAMIYGESPASSLGAETWNWFTKDFSSIRGSTGIEGGLLIRDPSIRVKESATTYSEAKLRQLKSRATSGRITVLGKPEVKLGDAIEIQGCPNQEINNVFQVRSLRHLLDKEDGFITEIGFCGLGE